MPFRPASSGGFCFSFLSSQSCVRQLFIFVCGYRFSVCWDLKSKKCVNWEFDFAKKSPNRKKKFCLQLVCLFLVEVKNGQSCIGSSSRQRTFPRFVCSTTFLRIMANVEEAISKDTPVRASHLWICVKQAARGSDFSFHPLPSLIRGEKLSFEFSCFLVYWQGVYWQERATTS